MFLEEFKQTPDEKLAEYIIKGIETEEGLASEPYDFVILI